MHVLDRDSGLNVGVGVVVLECEILVLEVEDAFDVWVDGHSRQFARFTGELKLCLLEVVEIEVGIAKCVYELADLVSCDLCDHHEQQCVGRDVEWHTEENVGAALVELQA